MPSTVTGTTARPTARPRHRVLLLTGVTAVAAVLALAACSSGGDGQAAAGAGGQTAAAQQGGGSGGGSGSTQRQNPGVSGEVAAIDGDIAQVQSSDSQTAVTWTSKTTVSQQVSGKLSDVSVGSCVLVTSSSDDASGSTDTSQPVAAKSVTVTAATDGECTSARGAGGFGGFGGGQRGQSGQSGEGQMPQGMPTRGSGEGGQGQMPQGMPTGMPTGGTGGFSGFGGFVSGKVTKVSGSTLTVEAVSFRMPTGTGTASGDATPSTTTTPRTVTVSGDTTYTVTKTAKTSAIKVGLCMTAIGEADSSGTVTATSVTLSQKTGDSCSTGFGGMGGGMGGGFGGRGQGSDGTGSDA